MRPASVADWRSVQVLRVAIEVRARRGLDAVGAVSEVHRVQVPLEDLSLGRSCARASPRGSPRGPSEPIECSGPVRTFFTYCWVIVEPPWLIEPLRDVRPRRANDRGHVETVVAVEVGILDRHHGLSERHRHLRQRDQDTIHVRVELRDLVPVAIEEHGRLRQGRDVRQLRRHVEGGDALRSRRAAGGGSRGSRSTRRAGDGSIAGAGAAAAQASSCVEPGGSIDGARVAGKALMASGASSVEASTRRSAARKPIRAARACTPSLGRVSGRHEHREDRPRGRGRCRTPSEEPLPMSEPAPEPLSEPVHSQPV